MEVISTKGCPFGDRLRSILTLANVEYSNNAKIDQFISGTFRCQDGRATTDIIEIIDFLDLGK